MNSLTIKKKEQKSSSQHLAEEFQIVDALTNIYSNIVLAQSYVAKHYEHNREIFHIGLLLDNIEDILKKLDKSFNILKDIEEIDT